MTLFARPVGPLITAAALLGILGAPASAQTNMPMDGMAMPMTSAPPASTQAYQAAMSKMDKGMMVPYTGDADVDFVQGMIPHHQGAIDMARVELKYGTDPTLKHLARGIIAAQEKEIAFMTAWLAQHKK